jgi:type IV pilus assembly protein PilF
MKPLALVVLTCAVLSGCVTTVDGEVSSAQKAAALNTQLGREYMARGQYEVAMEKLKKAVASDNDFAPAHTMLAVLYETIGEIGPAGENYREALRIDPDNGDINNNYGAYLCRIGKGEDADRYFNAAIRDPFYQTPAVAMANAGSCALSRGNLGLADEYLRKSLSYDPDFPDALLSLATLSYEWEDFLRARAFLQRYEAVAPMTAQSLLLGYRIESQMNNPGQARKYRDELIRQFPGAKETREAQDYTS